MILDANRCIMFDPKGVTELLKIGRNRYYNNQQTKSTQPRFRVFVGRPRRNSSERNSHSENQGEKELK